MDPKLIYGKILRVYVLLCIWNPVKLRPAKNKGHIEDIKACTDWLEDYIIPGLQIQHAKSLVGKLRSEIEKDAKYRKKPCDESTKGKYVCGKKISEVNSKDLFASGALYVKSYRDEIKALELPGNMKKLQNRTLIALHGSKDSLCSARKEIMTSCELDEFSSITELQIKYSPLKSSKCTVTGDEVVKLLERLENGLADIYEGITEIVG